MAENTGIDIVLPYVDSSVPEWQETFLSAKHKVFATERAKELFLRLFSNRYASYGMFRYWWRAYEKFGPPGKVHLLLQAPSQIPDWLVRNHPRVVIHYHEEFMPGKILPSFNSSCIELCFLHRHAKDLTPFFLMMNDDFYFNAPCTMDNFVEGDNPLTWKELYNGHYRPSCLFRSIVCNDLDYVSRLSGKPCPHYTHNHLAVCYKRDAIVPFLERIWPTVSGTMTQFRHESNYNHWILRYWQDHTGISLHSEKFPHRGYMEMPAVTAARIHAFENEKVLCFNDTSGKMSPAVESYLKTRLDRSSSFELG